MSDYENKPYKEYSLISDWFIFAALTLVQVFLFLKLKFNLDFSGKLTLLLHFCVSGIRISYSYSDLYSDWSTCTVAISNTLVQISLFYFVFELYMIKITLVSNLPQEMRTSNKKIKILRCITFILTFVSMIITILYFLIVNHKSQVLETHLLNALFIGGRIVKFIMESFVEILFMFLLIFFLKYRKTHIEKHAFSLYNYTVIVTILLLYSLCVLQSLLLLV